jgi:hypothetical protein
MLRALKKPRTFAPYLAEDNPHPDPAITNGVLELRATYQRQGLVGSFQDYRQFLESLLDLNLDIVPLRNLCDPGKRQKPAVSLRFDVDVDPLTALRLARCHARYGVASSFYPLHTAPYYGVYRGGRFIRSYEIGRWVRQWVEAGCEIGLHADPFCVYRNWRADGGQAVAAEIQWLRSQCADVKGTVGHNSFPVYGAESFEVFRERVINKNGTLRWGKDSIPLGTLSESEMGLTYEGNYASASAASAEKIHEWLSMTDARAAQNEDWMRRYLSENPYCEWGADCIAWLLGAGVWAWATGKKEEKFWGWRLSSKALLDRLRRMTKDSRAVIVVHDVFVAGD